MPRAPKPNAEAGGGTAADRLEPYRARRDFQRTSEPSGAPAPATQSATDGGGLPRFVIQKHHARRLHYDVRFEADGVLISWAVPKGPSLDPKVKRLAVHVEDHPLDYADFEGTIPGGEYGAGAVIVWDQGTYRNLTEKQGQPIDVADAVKAGHLSVWLDGTKLKGGWSLTRTSRAGERGGKDQQEQWIMVKRSDDHADPSRDITSTAPNSAITDRSLEEVRADDTGAQWHRGQATWHPPMLAQPLRIPDEIRAVDQPGWIYERKLDGLRGLAVRNGDQVELWSRNHLPFTKRFPEVVAALAALPVDNFTIDGELVAFDGERTSFSLLQRPGSNAQPQYHAFDLLHLLGRDTTGLPLTDRRRLLAQALEGAGERIQVVPAVEGDPKRLLEDACSHEWEGIIAKRADSTYTGGRSPDWRKLKCTASQELVVGGWTDPSGSRVGLGALQVGYYDDDGELHYAGKVGTGFDDKELAELHDVLAQLATDEPPFVDAERVKGSHWVRPELVVAVAFSEWTRDGRLRHPRFEGLRTDKSPREVRRELPPA
jgi:bifunctional non-homologous end joining protein LigD